ncbi:MAG: bifunctional hydroxymethylpyrimidine kinase/phosphomethylpyrimidine kinase [Proteobacteria bacterium]|nr:bifunctional hydroxymethylpyrimidine kinase/phosphomethylpyrimidine kinase [Pseudomonadota bacterium]
MKGRVLIVAGSDSGGGAGIQADIKAVTALRGYAMTAITALTAQNTEGVFAIHEVPIAFLRRQMEVVLDDLGADCVKTGMLHSAAVIETVLAVLEERAPAVPLVVDPVMVAKGGARLLDPAATETLKARLVPRARVITPNLPEAEALAGRRIASIEAMKRAAERLAELGPAAVFLKGGHLPGPVVTDLFLFEGRLEVFESPRIDTRHTHGTGCTLASAIAVGLAQGLGLREAAVRARAYVQEAIACAPGFGRGHGPLDHTHTVRPFGVPG